MADDNEREHLTEDERVEGWRELELSRAGYGPSAAHAIARRLDVDLHVAVTLRAQNCPVDTALAILL